MLVVDNLLANIDGRTVVIQGLFDRDNRPVDAGTVPPRGGQKHSALGGIVYLGHPSSVREIITGPKRNSHVGEPASGGLRIEGFV